MFDIGWSEMAVIALVALVVFGPKELPTALRTGAKLMKQGRKLAREFQNSVDQLVREAELEDAKKLVTAAKQGRLGNEIGKAIDPEGEIKKAVDADAVKRELGAGGTTAKIPAPVAPASSVTPPPPVSPPATPEPAAPPGEPAAPAPQAAEPAPDPASVEPPADILPPSRASAS
jgi:sec-independent protein translocase protein TatB